MLICTHRHTSKDLELWEELEAADFGHARSGALQRKIDAAIELLREFVATGPCYVSISGGKDSACVVGLLDEAGLLPQVPAVYLRASPPRENPDVPTALGFLRYRFPALPWVDVIDWRAPVDRSQRRAGYFFAAAREADRRHGRRIMGIRADESGRRLISMRHRGLRCGDVCRPIGWWTLSDVYAYAADRGIPLHPAYGMLGGGRWSREELRVDALLGEDGAQFGRAEWEREYYGDVLARAGLRA